jgi:hypothetical protein
MVSILPSNKTPWEMISNSIGQGLSQTLPQAAQQRSQRETGMNAIDQLQSQLAAANGDISKILPALAKAYTLNPNLERSGIGQFALEQARKGQAANPVLEAIGGGQGQGGMNPNMAAGAAQQAAQPMQQQGQSQSSQTPQGKGLFLNDFIPQNLGELITPEQEAAMISDVAKRGGDTAFTRQMIKDYNQGKIGFNDLANANVEKEAANVTRMLGFEDQIRDRIGKYIPQDTPEAEKNIYYNMVRPELESGKHKTFSDAWQKVSADIDNFRKQKEALVKRIPEPQIAGVSPEGEKLLRAPGQALMKKDPLAYNMLESAFTKKGHSAITPARIYKPLPPVINHALSKAEDFKDLVYPTYSTSELTPGLMERNMEMADRGQQKQIPQLAGDLRKNWNEDLSLLNMYADLKRKGWSLYNITSLMDDVSDLFGERQQAERNMLNENMRIPTRYLAE